MTEHSTTPESRQDFAALLTNYYTQHATFIARPAEQAPKGENDPLFNAFWDARVALISCLSPDILAIYQKALVVGHDALDEQQIPAEAFKSLVDDLAELSGASRFDPASWLYRWTEYRGGYVVQDGNVKLVSPAEQYSSARCELIGELNAANGRTSIEAHILQMNDSLAGVA